MFERMKGFFVSLIPLGVEGPENVHAFCVRIARLSEKDSAAGPG
jgi:hypothetical protein